MGRRTSTEAAHAALPDPMRSAVDAFARHLASERGRSTHTVRAYVADVVSLLDHAGRMGCAGPDDLDLGVLRSWLARLRTTGAARSSLARRSAAARTAADPGTTSMRTPSATWCPRSTSAAARRSSSRPLVHEPTNTTSTVMSRIGVPAASAMYSNAFAAEVRSASVPKPAGSGTAPSSGTPCPGLVPHVTNGVIRSASRVTSVSKVAPSSVTRPRQYSRAASHSAPFGA